MGASACAKPVRNSASEKRATDLRARAKIADSSRESMSRISAKQVAYSSGVVASHPAQRKY